MKKVGKYSFEQVERFLGNAEPRKRENAEKAREKNEKSIIFFEVVYDVVNQEMLSLSEILCHPDIKEMEIHFNELDCKEIGVIVPSYKDGRPETERQVFYNTKNSPEILKIISDEFSNSGAYKRENYKVGIELLVLQRLTKEKLKVLFFGHWYLKIEEEELLLVIEEGEFGPLTGKG